MRKQSRNCVGGSADSTLSPETALDEHVPERLYLRMLSARWPQILPKALEFVMVSSFFRTTKPCLMQNEALPALCSGEAVHPRTPRIGDWCFHPAFAGNSAHTKGSYYTLFQVRMKHVSPGSEKYALWTGSLGQGNGQFRKRLGSSGL